MGGTPLGIRWEAVYPLMDRLRLGDGEWDDLHDCLMVMEGSAMETMAEFAPKHKSKDK